jgi:hypothetical protein
MAAAKYNITVEQGATFNLLLTIKSPGVTPTPIDITTWLFAGQIRKSPTDATVLADFTFTIQNQISNTGEVLVSLTDADTSAIPADGPITNLVYDIEATVGSTVTRLIQGSVLLSAEVTR